MITYLVIVSIILGPQLDWDPDIVAGLDEDFDFDNPDNQLDDEFMSTANAVQLPDSLEEEPSQQPAFHPAFLAEAVCRPQLEDGEGFASDEAEDDFRYMYLLSETVIY